MSYCKKCGTQLEESTAFCPSCGTTISTATITDTAQGHKDWQQSTVQATEALQKSFQKFNDTKDATEEFDSHDIQQGKFLAFLSYIGILVLVPIFGSQNSKFIRFHANQGLILFIFEVLFTIANSITIGIISLVSWRLGVFVGNITGLMYWIIFGYAILGIFNVISGKAKELPLIGGIRILK